ncbi:hypothetical protein ACVWW5_002243 [Bradyrhizobium sp. LM3.4]
MAAAGQPKLIVEADAEALAQAAAERVMARIEANLGRIAICLTRRLQPNEALSAAWQRCLARQDPMGARALVHR